MTRKRYYTYTHLIDALPSVWPNKVLPLIAIVTCLVSFMAGHVVWAGFGNYNRLNPIKDYVPQEIGTYDTVYWELEEQDCRDCHGENISDRHHQTDIVLVSHLCAHCHEVTSKDPLEVAVTLDCLTSGCHSWQDREVNGWHHNTDMANPEACTSCHDPNLVSQITPVKDVESQPPTLVTPSPFSCENCHWGQDHVPGEDPDNPGHPSTYDHYDPEGHFAGFYNYSRPIYENYYTHHSTFKADSTSECHMCHGLEAGYSDWDPSNRNLIRACERCHTASSLHAIGPHVQDTNGWVAIGFHAPLDNTMTQDVDPIIYATHNPSGPYIPESIKGFTANEMCFGCHGDYLPTPMALNDCDGRIPVIDRTVSGINPSVGTCGVKMALNGQHFGNGYSADSRIAIRQSNNKGVGTWVDVPVTSWTDTRIEFQVPCGSFSAGNYKVGVKSECGVSNKVGFTIKNAGSALALTPEAGTCGGWITVYGTNFGDTRSEIFADGYHGVCRIVNFVGPEGTYTATGYGQWSNTSIKVRFWGLFQDRMHPITGQYNFVQDDGSSYYPNEPTLLSCEGIHLGFLDAYVETIFFGDDDQSGDLSCNDTIFQVTTPMPLLFELTNKPLIIKGVPRAVQRYSLMKIIGNNFGTTQNTGDKIYIGPPNVYKDSLGLEQEVINTWSNTAIVFRVWAYPAWEDTIKYIWVMKNGEKSNAYKIKILK